MKPPRVNDFDPKATPLLKSSLDHMPPIRQPSRQPTAELSENATEGKLPEEKRPPARTSERANERPFVRTPERIHRTLTRYSFEFFQDQIERLKTFSLEEQVRGEKGNMSKMVREAIDTYIAHRLRTNA